MTTRMKWLVGVLILVTVGAAVYFSILLAPPSAPGFNFFTGTTTTTSLPQAPNNGKPATPSTPAKPASGYSIQVHGKTQTITSGAAGATIDAPVNSVVSQSAGILSVRPPESKNGETILIQKSTGSFGNAAMQVPSLINGTQIGFDALRSTADNKEYNPNNIAGSAHVTKLRNRTVSGFGAVDLHVTSTAGASGPAQDFYLTWVHTGSTNWYITRTGQGMTPEVKAALDIMVNSIVLTR